MQIEILPILKIRQIQVQTEKITYWQSCVTTATEIGPDICIVLLSELEF